MDIEFIIGVLFVGYAIFKITVSLLNFTLPQHVLIRMHETVLGTFVNNDRTYAGRTFDVVLLVYAMYSLTHGLTLMGCPLPHLANFWKASFYTVLGLFVVVFYSLVLFTDIRISKTKSEYHMYSLYWALGYFFLMTATLVPYYGKWM